MFFSKSQSCKASFTESFIESIRTYSKVILFLLFLLKDLEALIKSAIGHFLFIGIIAFLTLSFEAFKEIARLYFIYIFDRKFSNVIKCSIKSDRPLIDLK